MTVVTGYGVAAECQRRADSARRNAPD